MLSLMQTRPLMISSIIKHAALNHATTEIVSRTVEDTIHRISYAAIEVRMRRLVRVLQRLGVQQGDRVGTLAWNGFRHLELYYAAPGMGAIFHTINPRLGTDDIAFIIEDAGDAVLFAETSFVGLIEALAPRTAVRHIVMMTDPANMPEVKLAPNQTLHCYETLMAAADEDYEWPEFDELTAAGLCYTSGTTGRPKGVLYSHRSTLLHAFAVTLPDTFGLRSADRVLPVVPMFHVNAWGLPFAAPMVGAALVMAGRHLDGASLASLMNSERVTFSAGVPTIWLGLLQHLRASGARLDTVKSLVIGGSACPPMLIDVFASEYGVRVDHAWGMTEMSPVGTYNKPKAGEEVLSAAEQRQRRLGQGRPLFGVEMKIVDDTGATLPRDGIAFGNLMVRGHWVCQRYYGDNASGGADESGWFATGDVATLDADGFMTITDRSKDVVKSGGEWISSITLENIAVAHPSVAEAAIIAAHHPKWDERPLLLVVPKSGMTIDPAELLASYAGHVPKWWLPDGVLVVPELPHTATGKLNKLALRTQYGQHFLNNAAE
ncbi:long-chain-fatty-acid--CoA ligase [Acidisphaera sp. L21]|uniref:long-chain-fatty-acid--CoA ligase n=1 Tax=Acidisphaera sp. L21 TaxID=1641851 RepID=UPI00131B8F79|nr:long-chain-fatty-acid--CoA ligase [Acidisphaera sp. L21]